MKKQKSDPFEGLTDTQVLARCALMVGRMDPKADGETLEIGAVLLASAIIGPDVERLSAASNVEPRRLHVWAQRWLANEVWTSDGKVAGLEWMDEQTGGVAFWMHVSVAMGFVERAKDVRP